MKLTHPDRVKEINTLRTKHHRDKNGYWMHPDALKMTNIDLHIDLLSDEGHNHPAYIRYFQNCETGPGTEWNPPLPYGDHNWFTLAIHDSQNGPVWVWGKIKK